MLVPSVISIRETVVEIVVHLSGEILVAQARKIQIVDVACVGPCCRAHHSYARPFGRHLRCPVATSPHLRFCRIGFTAGTTFFRLTACPARRLFGSS